MTTRQNRQNKPTVWLELATVKGQARLTLRLPRRWLAAALLLAATLWGGPEAAELLRSLL